MSTAFFDAVRSSLFGGKAQVDGMSAIDRAWQNHGDGDLRKLAYIHATAFHETGLEHGPKDENLNYTSASRIRGVWPSRFTLATAIDYVRQPQKLANKVYGGRLGDTRPNDGWQPAGDELTAPQPLLVGRHSSYLSQQAEAILAKPPLFQPDQ
jgi:putative chitinase